MLYNEESRSGNWYPSSEDDIPSMNENNYNSSKSDSGNGCNPSPDNAEAQNNVSSSARFNPVYAENKTKNNGVKVVLVIAVCLIAVALFIFALVFLFRSHFTITVNSTDVPEQEAEAFDSDDFDDFFQEYFGDYEDDYEETPDSDMYEYFENYYSGTSDINIAGGITGTGVTLNFSSSSEKDLSLQEIYTKVSPAVVIINTYQDGELYSWGSGVIFTADGYIITNQHILEGADSAEVILLDDTTYEATYLGSDSTCDIAVLKINGEDLPYAEFADSSSCCVGDAVCAIGNPINSSYTSTLTNGIISGIDRNVSQNGYTLSLIQTDAAINSGNSGGALINMKGQVIGITNMKVMYSYYTPVEGIGFAIPTSIIQPVVNSIIADGYVLGQPALGIVAGSVSAEAMALYDLPNGIYVSEVNENSDAYAQGIREGDIITSVNEVPVSSVSEVNSLKEGLQVGDTIECEVYREGETFTVRFALVDKSLVS